MPCHIFLSSPQPALTSSHDSHLLLFHIPFLRIAQTICSLLAPLLFNTEPKMHTMRGRSLECLGHVAVAIDSEHFERYFETGTIEHIPKLQTIGSRN